MYPEELCAPMREELTSVGFNELKTSSEVQNTLEKKGTILVVVNSVCGCAAGNARPGVKMAIKNNLIPNHLATVFAGQDVEATDKVREYMLPYPPSSPCIALFKDGEVVHILERHHIEGKPAELITENLVDAFNSYC